MVQLPHRNRPAASPSATAAVTTMTAIMQDRYGSAPEGLLRLTEIDRPTLGDHEVLVRVRAAGVDRGTWHIMSGLPYPIRLAGFGLRRPKYPNPGRNLAGTVEAVGAHVTGFALGDEVFGMATGTFAEYAAAPAKKLAPKPANLSFEQAAVVPVSGSTALQAVRDRGRVQAGEKVLIIGASGGVGSFAVQIAKAYGAEVTGVCSAAKVDLVRALGADVVIDYTREDFAGGPARYDVILDIGGNAALSRLRRALTRRGRLVIVGGETDGRLLAGTSRQIRAQLLSPFVSQKLGTFVASENAADLTALRDLLEAGSITAAIERTCALAEVPAAIRHLIDGQARGKLAVSIPPHAAQNPDPGSTP
jgi:NADPH:quinone reductase-like Zn-dependent oxidoreductase